MTVKEILKDVTNKQGFFDSLSQEVWENTYKNGNEEDINKTFERQYKALVKAFKNLIDKIIKNKKELSSEALINFIKDIFDFKVEDYRDLQYYKDTIINKFKEELRDTLFNQRFCLGGRIQANIGIEERDKTTLFNCFFLTPYDQNVKNIDSLDYILKYFSDSMKTLKSEGGIGINLSFVRPNGSYINGISTRTPGVLRFAEIWNKGSEVITSGTSEKIDKIRMYEKKKIRKGAMMFVLEDWHPEILNFISAKSKPNYLEKFNMSVGVSDELVKKVIEDDYFELVFPDIEDNIERYDNEWKGDINDWKEKNYPIKVYKRIKARELWNFIMRSTYERNEPGVLFLGLANRLNPVSYCEKIKGSNPCGEIIMGTSVCDLGYLVLVNYLSYDEDSKKFSFDYDLFKKDSKIATICLDLINDISKVPLPEFEKIIKDKRRISLGVMGVGSSLYMMNMEYGSQESINFLEKILRIKLKEQLNTSAKMGYYAGSFNSFKVKEHFSTLYWKRLSNILDRKELDEIESYNSMRNSHLSANAPTGNTSIFFGNISNGIEPIFSLRYNRWSIVPEKTCSMLRDEGFEFPLIVKSEWFETKDMKKKIIADEEVLLGSFNGDEYMVDKNRGLVKKNFVEDIAYKVCEKLGLERNLKVANELSVDDHISVLSVFSKYYDMNSSKTVNIPKNYSFEDFKKLYLKAVSLNIKGLTTYREGSTVSVLVNDDKLKECPNCKSKNIIEEDGCIHCLDCNWSPCSI